MPTPDDAAHRGAPTAAPLVEIRLPPMRGELFGREKELAWLDACWENGVQVAAIVAWGGVGKTSLVTRWMARLRDDGWRGAEAVFGWSFGAQGTKQQGSSDAFVEAALKWFGDEAPLAGSASDKGERLAKLVRARRTLLVLDGVEPLQSAVGEIGKLRDPALEALLGGLGWSTHGSLCVITSRLAVTDLDGMRGEKVVEKKLDHLSPEAGATLLRNAGVKGNDEELREASKEYTGHALALTLLGSYLSDVADGDIRRRKEIGSLAQDEVEGGLARKVMAAYEPWMGNVELSILRMIGLFDRPATEGEIGALKKAPVIPGLTDAIAGSGERGWSKAVARLRKVGLLGEAREHELDAHPLVREHFGEQLRRESLDAWREGHLRLYQHLAASAEELPRTIEGMAPLYAAVVHACLARKFDEAYELYRSRIQHQNTFFAHDVLGAFGSTACAFSAFFDGSWDKVAAGVGESTRPHVLGTAGFALGVTGRLRDSERLERDSIELHVARGEWTSAALGAINLSQNLLLRGKLADANREASRSVRWSDEGDDPFLCVLSRMTSASIFHAMGDWDQARAAFSDAEKVAEERIAGSEEPYSTRHFHHCDFLLDEGREAEVRKHAEASLKRAVKKGWVVPAALDHLSLGRAHLLGAQRGSGGDFAQAAVHLDQAVDDLRRRHDYLPVGLLARADRLTILCEFPDAGSDLGEALALAQRCGFRLHEADAHLGLARFSLAEVNPPEARMHLDTARRLIDETGYHRRDRELAELEAECSGEEEKERRNAEARRRRKTERGEAESPFSSFRASAPPRSPAPSIATHLVDFLIFAPLEEERDAVLSKLDRPEKLDSDGTDVHVYYEAEVSTRRRDGATYRIIVVSPTEMGPISAAITATAATARWKPAHVLVVGIAGGLKDVVETGDVIVASSVADYTVGKVTDDGPREERWNMVPADAMLLNAAKSFGTGWEGLVKEARPGGEGASTRHAGIIATGGDVIASKQQVTAFRKDMPKLIGVEMEGGGVATALHQHPSRPRFLMIRGVSDHADAEGNEETKKAWRAYARHVAAAYAIGLLQEGPVPALAQRPAPNHR